MSIKFIKTLDLVILKSQQVRYLYRWHKEGSLAARSLKQRLDEIKQENEDPITCFKVNIGLPITTKTRREVINTWMKDLKARRHNPEIEKASRMRTLLIDLKEARNVWLQTDGAKHINRIAQHYGIYQDLYGDAYFYPTIPLEVIYDLEDNKKVKAYTGNVIKPRETSNAPDIKYDADSGSLWTLLMTTPDGNLTSKDNEYCHWFIGNIPENRVSEGEELIDYLRPIAPYGIGYCRYIFVLYKQEGRIDYSEYKKVKPCLSLKERNWGTLDFYRKYQDQLTPAGLAFFQSDWDDTLKNFYHETLKMPMLIFRYDFPQPYYKKQEWFPLKQPFNLYLDKYRDPKQIMKEFLLRKLKKSHPFQGPEPKLAYPLAQSMKNIPSWLKFEIMKKRLKYGRVNDLDEY